MAFLKLAWGSFIVSLLVILLSFLTSQKAMRRQLMILDSCYRRERCAEDQKNFWSNCTSLLNIAAIVTFLAGVVFLAWFSVENLAPEDGGMGNKQSEVPLKEGRAAPNPPAMPRPGPPKPPPPKQPGSGEK
jgi:H+/Cl- antiporter ClcA